jgi:predicted nucleic acid-binding protein
MPTILDSNVVLDVLDQTSPWEAWSTEMLHKSLAAGPLLINQVGYSEVASKVDDEPAFAAFLAEIGCAREDIPWDGAFLAGVAHRSYRRNGGKRERTLPDFLIGGHAAVKGYSILTRDGSRYRSYFPSVVLVTPDSHP